MENLYIEKTNQSMEVDFNKNGKLSLKGVSTPDHVNRFFGPLFEWVNELKEEKVEQVELTMLIDYLNTSSTRVLIEFLALVGSLEKNNTAVSIIWEYDLEDEDMLELGEDLALVSGVEFIYKGVNVDY